MCNKFQYRDETEIMKPVINSIKYLWECGDPIMERYANNIMTAIGGNLELLGDDANTLIERYLNEEDMSLISM
jgi:hypothetical protein